MRKSDVAEYHFHALELGSLLAERDAAKAPMILRRSLSYVYREPAYRPRPVLDVRLQSTAPAAAAAAAAAQPGRRGSSSPGGGAGEAKDVLIVVLCVARSGTPQAFVPLAARPLLLPQAPAGLLSVQLPLELLGLASSGAGGNGSAGAAACAPQLSSRLSLVLLHQRSSQLASLVSLTSWQRSTSSRRRRDASISGKPLSPDVTASLAFQLLPSGSQVGYSVIPLNNLSASCTSDGAGGRQEMQQEPQEGPLQRQEGVITTHLPGEGAGSSPALRVPWIQLQQQGKEQQQLENGSGGGGGTAAFRYTLRVLPESMPSAQQRQEQQAQGQQQEQQQQQQQDAGRAGSKRKAAAEPRCAAAIKKRPQSALGSGAGAAGADQQGAALPPAGSQQQQQQHRRPPLVSFFFCSFDGTRSVRACAPTWACPLESCRGLRCHSYTGLQQHMQATHAYHSYYFSEVMPDGGSEVYLRCKPGWCDSQGSFLPRQLSSAALESHPLSPYLSGTRILRAFSFECPRRQRVLRRPGAAGAYPRDRDEEEAEAEAAAEHLAGEEEAEAGGSAPSSSMRRSSSLAGAVTVDSAGVGGDGTAPGRGGSKASGKAAGAAAAAAAAAPAARLGKGKGPGAAAPRKCKQAAAHVQRQGQGLTVLNHEGRPKFYHSRTCVAMTEEELTGVVPIDPNSEGEFAEWQRDCRERLAEHPQLCAEQREFMYEWNLWVRNHPIHADADLPEAVAAFAAAHAQQLRGDTPFRRCLTAYLLNLWRFRLLTPQQMHQLFAGLPRIAEGGGAAAGAAAGPAATAAATAAAAAAAAAAGRENSAP
ncbi:hypothetical protein ABPG75_005480 [Micractinium tetrahymenae]